MHVLEASDYAELSRMAAALVIDAVRAKPDLRLGFPTGNTPVGMYDELVRRHRTERIDFSGLRTFNLDEYIGLPQRHPKSYRAYMRAHFFDHVNVPPRNIHIPDGSPGVDYAAQAAGYDQCIQDAGGIDLLIAGLGANGHIAFNEPGSSFDSRTRAVTLTPQTIANAQRHFGPEPAPTRAITIGIANILEARRILLLVAGASKAAALHRALDEPPSEAVPASALQLHEDVTVIVDKSSAFRVL